MQVRWPALPSTIPRRLIVVKRLNAVVAAVAVAGFAGLTAGCSTHTSDSDGSGAPATTAKSDITALSPSMVVGRNSFPDLPRGDWTAAEVKEAKGGAGSETLSADDCRLLFKGPLYKPTSRVGASMSGRGERGGAEIYSVDIGIPSEEAPDWGGLVDKCSALAVVSNGHGGDFKMEPGNIEGLPSWATSYLATDPGGTGWIRAIIGNAGHGGDRDGRLRW